LALVVNVNSMFALIPLDAGVRRANGLFERIDQAEGTVLEARAASA